MEALAPAPSFPSLVELEADLLRVQVRREEATIRFNSAEKEVLRLEGEQEILDRVSDLFRALIDREVVENATTAQDLLTEGLRAVFDDLDLSVRASVDITSGECQDHSSTTRFHPASITNSSRSLH